MWRTQHLDASDESTNGWTVVCASYLPDVAELNQRTLVIAEESARTASFTSDSLRDER